MRRYATAGIITLLFLAGSVSSPVRALSGSYTIVKGTSPFVETSKTIFSDSLCNPTVAASLIQNSTALDAVILPIGPGEQGHHLQIDWSSTNVPTNGGLMAQYFVGCNGNRIDHLFSTGFPGRWVVPVPGDSSWVLIAPLPAETMVQVNITTVA